MKIADATLIVGSVALSATSQIFLKRGMISPSVQLILDSSLSIWVKALTVFASPFIFLGLALFGLSACVWLLVLSRIDLSAAYPWVALGILITTAAGFFLYGEAVSPTRVAGVALIVAGVVTVSFSM